MSEQLVLYVLCLVIAAGSLAVAVWTLVTGQIGNQGLDAVFLIVVCLVFAAFFGFIPLKAFRDGSWQIKSAKKRNDDAHSAKA